MYSKNLHHRHAMVVFIARRLTFDVRIYIISYQSINQSINVFTEMKYSMTARIKTK